MRSFFRQKHTREYWLDCMLTIGEPVLTALSQRTLRERIPKTLHPPRATYAPMEAFGRVACGMAPWLDLDSLDGVEEQKRQHYTRLLQEALDAATNPQSADYMVFDGEKSRQPLVDVGYLCHALLRAPKRLIDDLNPRVKNQLVDALTQTKAIEPWNNNWMVYSMILETTLGRLGAQCDTGRISGYLHRLMDFYKGDGMYGDGPDFHFDYYNSISIHPILMDVLPCFPELFSEEYAVQRLRAQRYAAILERMISPEGTYPIIGRSVVYRFGVFQLLAQAALQDFLPEGVHPAQVRCALTAVLRRTMRCKEIFDPQGWLLPGIYGHQPDLAEAYINTGSLYMCTSVFLPLGLPPEASFWAAGDERWTSQKVASGENFPADAALKG